MTTLTIQKRIDTIEKLNAEWYIVDGSQYFTEKEKAKRLKQIEDSSNKKHDELINLFAYYGLDVKDFNFQSICRDSLKQDVKELLKKNMREVEEMNKLIEAKLV